MHNWLQIPKGSTPGLKVISSIQKPLLLATKNILLNKKLTIVLQKPNYSSMNYLSRYSTYRFKNVFK